MNSQETMYRVTRVVWYVFSAIEALLVLRFILRLLAANPAAGFTEFVYTFSGIFLAPFRYVFGTPSAGGSALELSTLLAMIVYWLIAWGIVKLIVMNRPVSEIEARTELTQQDRA